MALAAIDCIQPAIELTKRRLFQPARYSVWWRIGFLGIFSGEMGNGGGFNYSIPQTPHTSNHLVSGEHLGMILAAVLVAAAVGILLFLALTYIVSVLRFVLFEAALRGSYRIREGWTRWSRRATSYFHLQLLIFVAFLLGLAVCAGIPGGLAAVRVLSANKTWDATSVMLVVVAVLLTIAWIISVTVFSVLSKDFVVPMMALEGLDYGESWRRLRPMIEAEKKSYVFYILMKIVLSLAAAVLLGVVALITIVAAGIPVGLAAFAIYFFFKVQLAGTLGIALAVAALILFVLLICVAVGIMSAPIAIFFPGYSIYFFAGRYRPLWEEMNPPAPPQAPPAPLEPAPSF